MNAAAARDLAVGGRTLASHAFKAALVDDWHLFIAPSIVGGGHRALPSDIRLGLELQDERRFRNGLVYLPINHQQAALRNPGFEATRFAPPNTLAAARLGNPFQVGCERDS